MTQATNTMILKEIKSLNAAVQTLLLAESARIERENKNDAMIIEHEHSIKGNGRLGLNTDVQILKDNMNRINWVGAAIVIILLGDVATHLFNR